MANSKGIKAPFFKKSEIQGEVDAFCAKYKVDQQQVPLDVELIVEADLHLELRPEADLYKKTEMDALLTSNRKTIMVDLDRFTRKNLQNRLMRKRTSRQLNGKCGGFFPAAVIVQGVAQEGGNLRGGRVEAQGIEPYRLEWQLQPPAWGAPTAPGATGAPGKGCIIVLEWQLQPPGSKSWRFSFMGDYVYVIARSLCHCPDDQGL